MKRNLSQAQAAIHFHCNACCADFKAEPSAVHDQPDQEHHPFRYEGVCPKCSATCPQAAWELGLFKAWMNATGPKTEAGKAATAKNLEGHPTPEEALRTRFNAMKHGMHARVATYFPARPDKYAFCGGCDVDRVWCGNQSACAKQTEIFMLHHAAMEQKKPGLLNQLHADFQSGVFLIAQMIVQQIIADGVQLKRPVTRVLDDGTVEVCDYFDENGTRHILYNEIQHHPLFRPLGELLSKNNMSLADMGVTHRVVEKEDEEALGYLEGPKAGGDSNEYAERQMRALEGLHGMIEASRKQRQRDPVLIEHDAQEGLSR